MDGDKLPSFSPKVASPWLSTAANPRVGIYDGRRLPPSLSSWLLRAETAALAEPDAEPLLPPSNSKRGRGLLDPCKKKKSTMFNDVLDIFWSVAEHKKIRLFSLSPMKAKSSIVVQKLIKNFSAFLPAKLLLVDA